MPQKRKRTQTKPQNVDSQDSVPAKDKNKTKKVKNQPKSEKTGEIEEGSSSASVQQDEETKQIATDKKGKGKKKEKKPTTLFPYSNSKYEKDEDDWGDDPKHKNMTYEDIRALPDSERPWNFLEISPSCEKLVDWYGKEIVRREPGAFGIYIYNDYGPYGCIEVMENALLRVMTKIHKGLLPHGGLKAELKDAYANLVALTVAIKDEGSWTMADDGDRVVELGMLLAQVWTTVYRLMDRCTNLFDQRSTLPTKAQIEDFLKYFHEAYTKDYEGRYLTSGSEAFRYGYSSVDLLKYYEKQEEQGTAKTQCQWPWVSEKEPFDALKEATESYNTYIDKYVETPRNADGFPAYESETYLIDASTIKEDIFKDDGIFDSDDDDSTDKDAEKKVHLAQAMEVYRQIHRKTKIPTEYHTEKRK